MPKRGERGEKKTALFIANGREGGKPKTFEGKEWAVPHRGRFTSVK